MTRSAEMNGTNDRHSKHCIAIPILPSRTIVCCLLTPQSTYPHALPRAPTRFDFRTSTRYCKELRVGDLRWGPTHTEKFWREHAQRFDSHDFGTVQELIKIVQMAVTLEKMHPGWGKGEESKEGKAVEVEDGEGGVTDLAVGGKPLTPLMIAIACYDLGEFVRFYPQGKAISKNLGAKDQVRILCKRGGWVISCVGVWIVLCAFQRHCF